MTMVAVLPLRSTALFSRWSSTGYANAQRNMPFNNQREPSTAISSSLSIITARCYVPATQLIKSKLITLACA
jgi:hypothetical protein